CLSVAGSTTGELLSLMKRSSVEADLMELRIDGTAEMDLPRLLEARTVPVLVTNRSRSEGGSFAGSDNERCVPLLAAVEMGAEYVDVEMNTERSLIQAVVQGASERGGRTKVVLSYHDFTGTPSDSRLRDLVDDAFSLECHMVKIATTAVTEEDNLRVLRLVAETTRQNRSITAFCMGKLGRISRIAAPFFGSAISFACLEKGAETAPGQFTAAELKILSGMIP
ncbi:MAG TPA: type I 3-dehydroquinate dehydratase, partial [Deltaproteobacteria bacterium]|nr:type I 3-dehydroquinate dehydratase [Deltaproteobacteria bacterium]